MEGILIAPKENRKSRSRWIGTIIIIIMALITWILTYLARDNSHIVERVYSAGIYPYIAKSIGWVSGVLIISFSEIFILGIFLLVITAVGILLIKPKIILKNRDIIFHYTIRALAILYILFYFLWGFNYYREDYVNIAQLNKEPGTLIELIELTQHIIENANDIRGNLIENGEGVFLIEDSFKILSQKAKEGFEDLMVGPLNLGWNYGQAKPILLSNLMSYTGIMGIYFPYTSEPNINIDIPHVHLPATISHEMAHQRGFAKEDEANFIAFKASINNSDMNFQYSGYYLAMQYLMNEVYKEDRDTYYYLYSTISEGVKRDMNYSREFWKSREGKTEEIVTAMNDNYLKANNQEQGIRSYNRVVELLLSEYKSLKAKE